MGGLLVLALTAALVVPYFIDWSNYRADFEREAGRILGREVKVRGDATARLLPFPSVTFSDVEVAGTVAGEPAITVETFSMDAELAPFMRGELFIFDMRIVRPRARLAIAADGTIDWTLRPSTPFDASHVQLEKLTVTEGMIEVSHAASGRVHRLSELNADISARTLAGPWRIAGSGRLDGQMTALSVTTGAAENGHMRLRLRAEPERYGFVLDAEGDARVTGGALAYDGSFRLAARQEPAPQGQPAPPPAYRVSGKFEVDHEMVTVPEFRLETGPLADPYTADGHADIRFGAEPRFAVTASGAQLRFDDDAAQEGGGIDLGRRLSALRTALGEIPRPVMQGSIELKLPAIVAGDTTVRDVQLSAEPAEEGWTVKSLHATLPGRATLEASGQLNALDDFGFRGRMLLAVAQPSGFAAWLSDSVDEAIRRLPSAGFDATVDLTAERQSFENLELSLGGARFDGRIENLQPAGQRGRMALDLSGGRLDLEGVAAFAALFVSPGGDARLADHDLDFKVKAGPVIVSGLVAETVDTQLRLRDDRLEVDRLSVGGLHGADISATGRLTGIGGTPAGRFDATVLAGDLAPLVREVAERLPAVPLAAVLDRRASDYPGLLEDAALDLGVEIGGTAAARSLKASLGGEAGGSALNLALETDALGRDLTNSPLAISFTASNDEPAALYALAGIQGLPLGFAGKSTIDVSIGGTLADAADARIGFRAEGMELAFDGTLAAGDDGLGAEGQLRIGTPDLEPWLMTAGMSLPGMGLGLPVELAGALDLRGGLAILSGLDGTIAGTAVSGDVNAEMRDGRPHLTGSLETESLDMALVAEALFGEAAFQVAGDDDGQSWPRVPFQPAARVSATGELELNAETLRAGMLRARNARLTARLDKDGLRVSDLSAELHGGRLGGLFEVTNNAGTGLFSGQLFLDGAVLGEVMPGSGLLGTGTFGAALTANGKSVDAMIASLAGSGTVSLSNLSLPGLRPDAFGEIVAAADEIGPRIDAVATAMFAPDLVSEGRFEAGSADLAVTVASGVARAPALRLQRPDAVLTVEPRFDLGRWAVAATGELEFAAGDEAVTGGNPAVRFAAAGAPGDVSVEYDTEPLAQFLTQRALEREQARVEAMQTVLLERQRLRREVRYYASLADERERLAEEARIAAEAEAARLAAEEAARRAAQEEEVRRAAEEANRRAEEAAAARREAEEAVRRATEAEEAARAAAEAERSASETVQRRQAEEAARGQGGADGLPGVNTQPFGTALPRPNDGAGVFRPGNLNFGQAPGAATP